MAMKIEATTRKIISLSSELDNNRRSDMSASTSLLPPARHYSDDSASLLPTIDHHPKSAPIIILLVFILSCYFSLLHQCFVSIFKSLISDSKLHRHILTWIISNSKNVERMRADGKPAALNALSPHKHARSGRYVCGIDIPQIFKPA